MSYPLIFSFFEDFSLDFHVLCPLFPEFCLIYKWHLTREYDFVRGQTTGKTAL